MIEFLFLGSFVYSKGNISVQNKNQTNNFRKNVDSVIYLCVLQYRFAPFIPQQFKRPICANRRFAFGARSLLLSNDVPPSRTDYPGVPSKLSQ